MLQNTPTRPLFSAIPIHSNDGLFAGYDSKTHKYDKSKWSFQKDANGNPLKDRTLQDPRCVFQQLKKHFNRYDLDTRIQRYRDIQRPTSAPYTRSTLQPAPKEKPEPSCTPWDGPSTRSAYRTSEPWPSSSSCWAIWEWPAGASMRCGGNRMSRGQPTTAFCFTSGRVI